MHQLWLHLCYRATYTRSGAARWPGTEGPTVGESPNTAGIRRAAAVQDNGGELLDGLIGTRVSDGILLGFTVADASGSLQNYCDGSPKRQSVSEGWDETLAHASG